METHPNGYFCICLHLSGGVDLYKLGDGTNDQSDSSKQNVYYQTNPLIFPNRSYGSVGQYDFRLTGF